MPTITPQEFVAKWKSSELKERSSYQEHFLNICQLIEHPTPAELDAKGKFFTFEAGASKTAGGNGFADVWYLGHFAWEYKGKHANLEKAYDQLLQYKDSLQNPPLLIVSDTDVIRIHTNFTNSIKKEINITFEDILSGKGLKILRQVFTDPEALRPAETTQQVTEEAAKKFARLADRMRNRGEDATQSAHFIIRLLFCLFSEDIGLLPDKLFTRLVTNSRTKPERFNQQLIQLFNAMSTGGVFGVDEIKHFNGHLYENAEIIPLGVEDLAILYDICRLDWAQIEPSILGTLFERSLDPTKRSQLGAHYTSKEDILLIVEPVLMAPLRRRWLEVREQAEKLAVQIAQEAGKKRENLLNKLSSLIMDYNQELAVVRILDPACGSGNFLYIALRQLLDLWKEVTNTAARMGLPMMMPFDSIAPSPEQLHGIELNIYAHQLAQATIWIGYIQWLVENGFGTPPEPIPKTLDSIQQMDAILAYDSEGNPYEPDWPEADVIIGNPPFLGGNKIRAELGDKTIKDLFSLYENRVPAFADLVCYWFEKASQKIRNNSAKRIGLLATNSIRGGVNRAVLDNIKNFGDIFWAISDKDWVLEGAAVNVSLIGIDNGTEQDKQLDGKSVININSNLTANIFDLSKARTLKENSSICFMGPSAKGPFDLEEDAAKTMLVAPKNINGCPNSDVIKRVVSAIDIVQTPRHKWTIDFGLMPLEQASIYEIPFEYIKKVVYPIRSQNRRLAYAEKWWQYAEARPGMRAALENKERFICTPGVSKYRIFVWYPVSFLCNQGTFVIAREDDYFIGVLQSKIHGLWSLSTGTSLEDRPRYTPTTTFETFPFPWPPGTEPVDDPLVLAIAQAAKELVEKRDIWLNPLEAAEAELKKRTLTNLYNQNPTWLQLAHQKLDQSVFAAYGWPNDLSDDEILERLLALNLERSKNQ